MLEDGSDALADILQYSLSGSCALVQKCEQLTVVSFVGTLKPMETAGPSWSPRDESLPPMSLNFLPG